MENMDLTNKRILITGATSYLAKKFWPFFIHSDLLEIDRGDVEQNTFEKKMTSFGPELIFHFATVYGRGGENEKVISKVNFDLPQKLFLNLKKGIFVNCDTKLPREVSTYALYKNLFREWAIDFADNQKRFLNLKLEHFYGPRAPAHNFVTSVANKLSQHENIPLTEGLQQRDFVYIDDCVEAMHLCVCGFMRDQTPYQEIEVGSGQVTSIRDLVLLMKKISGSQSQLKFGAIAQRPHEVMYSAANMHHLSQLGFKPQINLERGLALLFAKDQT